MTRTRHVLVALLATTALAIFLTSSASADSDGAISCALAGGGALPTVPSGDYQLSPGQTISCTITGADAPSGGASTTFVYVKHGGSTTTSQQYALQSGSNNEMVPATYAGGVISFTYSTVGLSTCNTAALSYNSPSGAVNNSKGANSTFDFNNFCNSTPPPPPPPAANPLTAGASGNASYTRTYAWSIAKSVDRSSASYVVGNAAPVFNYTVNVSHDAGTDSGWAVSGSIAAGNPNSASVSGVGASLSDSHCTVSGGSQTIPGSGSGTWNFSCSYPSAGPSSLSATIAWSAQTLSDGSVLAAGSATSSASLDWSNPSSVVNGSVDVTDTVGDLGTVSASGPSTTTIPYALQLAGTPGTCSPFTNTASLSGGLGSSSQTVTVCAVENPALGTPSATDSFTRTYAWSVGKSVDTARQNIPAGGSATFNYTVNVSHDSGTDSDWSATGTITAANDNDSAISGATASIADANCTVDPAQAIPAKGSATWNFTCSWNSAPPASEAISVAWSGQTLASGGNLPSGEVDGNVALDWSTPTNVVNGSVDVNDSRAGDLGSVSVGDANPTALTYAQSFAGNAGTCTSYGNTASLSTGASSSASVEVCDGVDLTASATSGTSFTRTYAWSVGKTVNGSSLVEKSGGGSGSFSYTVTVTHDAGTDSAWQAIGTITVTNPNDWESVNASVSDAVDNGGTCTVANGGSVTLAPGASATVAYTCTYASAPTSPSGTDTVTVSWDKAGNATPDASATATASVTFGAPTTVIAGSTVVSDSLKGTLGTLTSASPASTSYTYSLSFAVPASNCATHPNVASLSVGGSASASVELCGLANTGALSQGYWQNKNGQAIITGSAATGGVCNVGTWLRQFAPFQDLAANASCATVNTYVQGVIGSATAKGAAMNPMLKSQMLAVALNVYFSDPTLGGNKIGAPQGIGSWAVDLTNVSGENTAAGFGGSTRLTILQMLQYAASEANAGGSTWYGQNKATQGLAKDAFDAICNSQVFAP